MRVWLIWLAIAAAVALCGCYGAGDCAEACKINGGRMSGVGFLDCSCSLSCTPEARP